MPSKGRGITIEYVAWDTSANAGKTGDAANHTLRWIKDGVSAAPTNAASEVDSANVPGVYKLTLTDAECTCDFGTLAGKSSTANVSIMPTSVGFESPLVLGTLTITGTPTTTSIAGTSGNMGTVSGLYTGRRLYIPLAAGGYLLTGTATHTYSGGTHTFSFASANTGTPAAGDVAEVVGP